MVRNLAMVLEVPEHVSVYLRGVSVELYIVRFSLYAVSQICGRDNSSNFRPISKKTKTKIPVLARNILF